MSDPKPVMGQKNLGSIPEKFTPPPGWVPSRGEIIWLDFGDQPLPEMRDRHSMLVVSKQRLNALTSLVTGFPMSSSPKNAGNYFSLPFIGPDGRQLYILANQLTTKAWRDSRRVANPHAYGRGYGTVVVQALARFQSIIGLE